MDTVITTVASREDIFQILDLQANNLVTAIPAEVAQAEGFLTVRHETDVLWRMNEQEPSVIAKKEQRIIGYALIMPHSFAADVPILKPMFEILGTLSWRGIPLLGSDRWFVMGQICVARDFRGQGVFDALYHKLKAVSTGKYDFIVTEVAERNIRSMRAHERVGFKTLHQHKDDFTGEIWRMIILEL